MKEPKKDREPQRKNDEHQLRTAKTTSSSGDESKACGGGNFWRINRKTLPLKITLLLFYGAMSAILPYLTIHMKDIGISLSQIAVIYAVLPFTAFLGPPIMGFMADKMGQYKAVLLVATVINGVAHTLLLLVPKYSESLVFASAVIEFNIGEDVDSPAVTAVLKPLHMSHCSHFINSLKYRQSSSDDDNGMIHIHSCNWEANENETSSGPIGRGVTSQWTIPNHCQYIQLSDSEELDHSIFCEYWENMTVTSSGHNRSTRSIKESSSTSGNLSKCDVRLGLDEDAIPGSGVQQKEVYCQTNYTYPTGEVIENGNGALTFWLYFVIRIVANVFMAACFSLLDATTLAVVEMNKGAEYGKERILCVVGNAVVSPLAGLLVDAVSASKGYTDYSAAFFVADAMLCANIIGYFFMDLNVEKPTNDMWKNATALLNYPEVVMFLGMIFIMGNMWGFVESYLFIFLDELHAPKYLLGLTLTVGSLASVPFLYVAEGMVAKVGRVNIIVLAFLVYFIRCFGYSYIPNPFWCFPFEAMEAFTYHLMWVAAATYCALLAPKGLLGTLTGVMGSLHYGLGKGSGAFIGGYVISMSTSRLAFRYFGIFAGAMGLIYFLINTLWLESAIRRRNERENSQEPDVSAELSEQKEVMLKISDRKDNQIA